MSESKIIPVPEWQTGIPSKLASNLLVVIYQGDYEFGRYSHTTGKWSIFVDGGYLIDAQEPVECWHYVAKR